MRKIVFIIIIVSFSFLQCEKDNNAKLYTSSCQGGALARFAIVGNYMYTVDDQKLTVYDVANPGDPVVKSTVNVGFEIETIFPFKDKLFIGSSSVVYIYSVTDPLNPKKLSEAISPEVLRRCDPVVAKDTVAFATLRTNGPCGGVQSILAVYDIKDITKPKQRGSYPVTEPYGLGYQDNALYVCDKEGLLVFDITNAYAPLLKKTLKDGEYIDVIPYQGTLVCWITTGVVIYDISDNQSPLLLAKIL